MKTEKHLIPAKIKIAGFVGTKTVENPIRPNAKVETKVFKNTKRSPRTRITCLCCSNSVDIYFDETYSEINGVMASNDFWRKIFSQLPK